MDTYSDVHRAFLQSCLSRGCIIKIEAIRILEHIFSIYNLKAEPNDFHLENIIHSINEKIGPFGQKIVQTKFDQLNDSFVVFCNTADTDITKLQNIYSAPETEFFRLLLKEIARNENNFTNQIDALNLVEQIKAIPKVSKYRAQELLDKWNCECYFLEIKGEIYYGPRTIAEFSVYLKQTYPDFVRNCKLCISPVFAGIGCGSSVNVCDGIFHKSCLKKYIARNNVKCPECQYNINI